MAVDRETVDKDWGVLLAVSGNHLRALSLQALFMVDLSIHLRC